MAEVVNEGSRGAPGTLTAVSFAVFVILGWLAFGYAAFALPGGLAGAWSFVRGLPLVVQLVAWLLLLPWMLALWLWNTSWALWLRALLILGLWWVTMMLSIPPLFDTFKSPR